MIHVRLDGDNLSPNVATLIKQAPLNTVIGPSEFVLGTVNPTKIVDFSGASAVNAVVVCQNRANFSIFWCLGTPGTPTLTTANGDELLANSFLTLDNIGGLCIWAIAGTVQTAGNGTRVSGGDLV